MQHHDLCRNLPSPSPDRFRTESSAITADDSSAPGPSTEWTDEKHSMYLDSLETTFVNQLHNSLAHGCLRKILWGPYSYRAMPTNNSISVYQDGKIQNTNPKRNNLSLESTADSHIILENRHVEHLSSSGKRRIAECRDQEHNEVSYEILNRRDTSPESSARIPLKHSTEVSDQNFVDVSQEERSNCRATKRSKRVIADNSSNDQVVLCRNPTANYASTSRLVSSVISQTDRELQSENLKKLNVSCERFAEKFWS